MPDNEELQKSDFDEEHEPSDEARHEFMLSEAKRLAPRTKK